MIDMTHTFVGLKKMGLSPLSKKFFEIDFFRYRIDKVHI